MNKKVLTPSLPILIIQALDTLKAQNIVTLNVSELTDVADTLVIATANSNRQLRALIGHVVDELGAQGALPVGVEGVESEWALVDFGDVVVHVMLSAAREFYNLEHLWQLPTLVDCRADQSHAYL